MPFILRERIVHWSMRHYYHYRASYFCNKQLAALLHHNVYTNSLSRSYLLKINVQSLQWENRTIYNVVYYKQTNFNICIITYFLVWNKRPVTLLTRKKKYKKRYNEKLHSQLIKVKFNFSCNEKWKKNIGKNWKWFLIFTWMLFC